MAAPSGSGVGDGATGTRPFRSKKQRPCDACRKRKNRCAIPVDGQPCTECQQTKRPCTFLLPPPTRPKKESFSPTIPVAVPPVSSTFPSTSAPPSFPASSPENDERVNAAALAALREKKRVREDSVASVELPPTKRSSSSTSNGIVSLDRDLPGGVEPCCVTATLTDDLLTFRTVGASRQISADNHRAQFILFHGRPAHRVISDEIQHTTLRRIRSFLSFAAPDVSEEAILEHYLTRLHPSLPVLPISSQHSLDTLPPGVTALLLVTALSYLPALKAASSYAWNVVKEARLANSMLEAPKLSSLSAALLELDSTTDPRNDFALLAKTIAHAQLLGLHVDCSRWAIPDWEKSLRNRIWWALRIHDAWASFLNSRPSHVQAGNTNVPLPLFPTPDGPIESFNGMAFAYSSRLAVIVARLQAGVSILDQYGSPARADSCDHLEQELNTMKDGARPFLEMSRRPVGMDSFLFLLLGLRCMVRRISIEVRIGLGNSFLPDSKTLELFADFVKYAGSLADEEGAFTGGQHWICYSSHVLSSVLSSLIRLSLAALSAKHNTPPPTAHGPHQSTTASPSPAVHLLAQLCILLETAYQRSLWSIAEAALNRADNVAERLAAVASTEEGAEDYAEVVAALRRQPLPTPPPAAEAVEAEAAGPFDGLNALASLAHGGTAAWQSAAAAGESPWPGSTAAAETPSATLSTVALEGFGLPDLEEWLNVLDETPLWGGDGTSPSSWISW
ncbi:hypothetical protein JCM10207_002958 [Rhodosporidiobolus poonsookiae]